MMINSNLFLSIGGFIGYELATVCSNNDKHITNTDTYCVSIINAITLLSWGSINISKIIKRTCVIKNEVMSGSYEPIQNL